MESQMIVRIENCLDKLKQKPVTLQQKGFIVNQFFIDKLIYKVQNDIISLRDETKEVYLSLNLNQVYQIEFSEEKINLYLDNDTEIQISI